VSDKPNVDETESTPEASSEIGDASATKSPEPSDTPARGSLRRWGLVAGALVLGVLITNGNGLLGWATGAEDEGGFSCGGGPTEATSPESMALSDLKLTIDDTLTEMDDCNQDCSQAQFLIMESFAIENIRYIDDVAVRSAYLEKLATSRIVFGKKKKDVPEQFTIDANTAPAVLETLADEMDDALAEDDVPPKKAAAPKKAAPSEQDVPAGQDALPDDDSRAEKKTVRYLDLRNKYIRVARRAADGKKLRMENILQAMPIPAGGSALTLTSVASSKLGTLKAPSKTEKRKGSQVAGLSADMAAALKSKPPAELIAVVASAGGVSTVKTETYSSCRLVYVSKDWFQSPLPPIQVYERLARSNYLAAAIMCTNDAGTKTWGLKHDSDLSTRGSFISPIDGAIHSRVPRAFGVNRLNFKILASMLRLSLLPHVGIKITGYNGVVKKLTLIHRGLAAKAEPGKKKIPARDGVAEEPTAQETAANKVSPSSLGLAGSKLFDRCKIIEIQAGLGGRRTAECIRDGKKVLYRIPRFIGPREGPVSLTAKKAILLNPGISKVSLLGFSDATFTSLKSMFELSADETISLAITEREVKPGVVAMTNIVVVLSNVSQSEDVADGESVDNADPEVNVDDGSSPGAPAAGVDSAADDD
jgi:hypothetical protein